MNKNINIKEICYKIAHTFARESTNQAAIDGAMYKLIYLKNLKDKGVISKEFSVGATVIEYLTKYFSRSKDSWYDINVIINNFKKHLSLVANYSSPSNFMTFFKIIKSQSENLPEKDILYNAILYFVDNIDHEYINTKDIFTTIKNIIPEENQSYFLSLLHRTISNTISNNKFLDELDQEFVYDSIKDTDNSENDNKDIKLSFNLKKHQFIKTFNKKALYRGFIYSWDSHGKLIATYTTKLYTHAISSKNAFNLVWNRSKEDRDFIRRNTNNGSDGTGRMKVIFNIVPETEPKAEQPEPTEPTKPSEPIAPTSPTSQTSPISQKKNQEKNNNVQLNRPTQLELPF